MRAFYRDQNKWGDLVQARVGADFDPGLRRALDLPAGQLLG
jgi:hypothetical protein